MNNEEWWVGPVLAVLGVLGVIKLWQSAIRPWIDRTWSTLAAGDTVDLPVLGAVDRTDLIGLGVLLLVLLVAIAAGITRVRRQRARRELGKALDQQLKGKSGKGPLGRSW